MVSSAYLCLCLYCMLQLAFFIVVEIVRRNMRVSQEEHFLWMLIIAFFSFSANILSNLGTKPEWLFTFSAAGNYAEIILNLLLLPIFFRYACEQINGLQKKLKRRIDTDLWISIAACAALVLSTSLTGWIFYYDEAQNYHRGPLFWLMMAVFFIMIIIVEAFIISQRKKIESASFGGLSLFLLPPLVGWALQSLFYGLPFSLLGITFAAQVVFTNIQNRKIDKDYLTGAYNRQTLDSTIQRRIDQSSNRRTFSAILLDIDNFKSINDSFGHFEGDLALINTVNLLRESAGHGALVARYGGDEICVILGSGSIKELEDTVRRIRDHLSVYNQSSNKPYRLSFSMGYALYHPSMGDKAEHFLKEIDRRMYRNKKTSAAVHINC